MNSFYWFFVAIILFSTIFLLYKKGWYPKKYYAPWGIFGKLLSLAAFVGMCYGIYLLVVWVTPDKSERLFRQVVEKQKAQEIEPLLKDMEEIAKGTSTAAAIGEAKKIKDKIESIEKKYDKVLNPESVKAPLPPRVYVEWVLEWYATKALLERHKNQEPSFTRKVTSLSGGDHTISISYIDEKKRERTIELHRDKADPSIYYEGSIWNHKNREYIPILLIKTKPEDEPIKNFYDEVSGEKITKEIIFWGWESEKRGSGSLDMEVWVVKKTSVNKTASIN